MSCFNMLRSLAHRPSIHVLARHFLSTLSARSILTSARSSIKASSVFSKKEIFAYTAGGASLAVIGLLWAGRDTSGTAEEPYDV